MVWIFMLVFLACQPALAEEKVVDTGGTEVSTAVEMPALAYSESPFEQGTTTNRVGEILGSKTGYVHPYLGIGEYFTDNLFSTESNRQSDFFTRITPGIWMTLPASKYPIRQLRTLNTAPGGLALSRFRSKGKSRLQGYASYQADILRHSRFTSEDHVNQRAEGYFRYNFRGGLSVELLDIYELNHDAYNTGSSNTLDKFKSNLLNAVISYEISPKTSMEAEYGFYNLSYDQTKNQFRNRDDHSFIWRGFYRFLPKTSALVEYNFITIDYDDAEQSDSDEHRVYLGLQWEQSRKSRWRVMAGMGEKDFARSGRDDATNVLAELQFLHRFTPKTYAELRASRTTNETDSFDTEYTVSHRILFRYYQRITARLLASVIATYGNTKYKGGSTAIDREDHRGTVGFDVKYTLTNWLAVSGGYTFVKRHSNIKTSGYDKNNVYINFIFSL
ncbi:outer membrane beta-barrel protein [Syntrophotalea carbinolica]|nr:outer membrane beta-barrel protein [Syntrophotalea carbinolica]